MENTQESPGELSRTVSTWPSSRYKSCSGTDQCGHDEVVVQHDRPQDEPPRIEPHRRRDDRQSIESKDDGIELANLQHLRHLDSKRLCSLVAGPAALTPRRRPVWRRDQALIYHYRLSRGISVVLHHGPLCADPVRIHCRLEQWGR